MEESIRQRKVAQLLQEEVSEILRINARDLCLGAMVSVTVVRVTPDLKLAKVYLSIFGVKVDAKEVLKNIKVNSSVIRGTLGRIIAKQLRVTPELMFFVDDSLDYAAQIDDLLKE